MRIGTGFAVEIERFFPREGVILYPAVIKHAENECTDADLPRNLLLVFKVGTFLLDNFKRFFNRGIQNVLKVNSIAFACGESHILHADNAETDMNAILCPIVAHKLKHLENLAEMQALLISNNIQGLIEIVSVLAIFRSGNVAGCINGASVALKDYAGRHIIFGEIDNGHAVVDFCKPLILKLLHNIECNKFADGIAVFDFFSVAPFVVCNDHFSELRSPITEVIDADGLVAQMVKDTPERISENRCCDMVDAEGLCDVYGRIIQADILSAAFG